MQKRKGHSPALECANDACSIPLARKPVAIALLPLFSLPCFSENCQSPRVSSMSTAEHHRLSEMATGHGKMPSAADEVIGHSLMAGRH